MRNVLDKSYRENRNTHFMLSNFFFSENRTVNEIMSKNMVETDRPQVSIWRMRVVCWISNAACTYAHAQTDQ
jgi:hypothetical protein